MPVEVVVTTPLIMVGLILRLAVRRVTREPQEHRQNPKKYAILTTGFALISPIQTATRLKSLLTRSYPKTFVEYKFGKHECSYGNEVVAEQPDCPQTGRFRLNIMPHRS